MTDGRLDAARSFVGQHGFLSWLGVGVEAIDEGRVVLSVPAREELRNVDGGVRPIHGGVVATLVDTASGFALRTTFEDPADARRTTTDLDVSSLRPAMGDLRATATVVRAGRSMGVVDVRVTGADGSDGGTTDGDGGGISDAVKIGHLAPLNDPLGIGSTRSAEMAVASVNEDGGIGGQDVELVTEDTRSQPSAARSVTQTLIRQEALVGVIGPNGAGKTTMLDAVGGFVPSEGTVRFEGGDLARVGQREAVERGRVYCIEDRDRFPFFWVHENLLMGAQFRDDEYVRESSVGVHRGRGRRPVVRARRVSLDVRADSVSRALSHKLDSTVGRVEHPRRSPAGPAPAPERSASLSLTVLRPRRSVRDGETDGPLSRPPLQG